MAKKYNNLGKIVTIFVVVRVFDLARFEILVAERVAISEKLWYYGGA